jgi:LysM repeat protein
MKNRKLSSPILCALVLSLVAHPALPSQAETDVSNTTYSAPAEQPAPAPAPAAAASGATVAPVAKHTTTYTVMAGDSLTSIAKKFNTTRKKLRQINNLAASTVKPGQTLLVPSRKSARTATAAPTPQAKILHEYTMAQPVQDFDIPASTFASCPVPIPSPDEDADSTAPDVAEKPAPIAKLVSPAELAADPPPERGLADGGPADGSNNPAAPTPRVTKTVIAPNGPAKSLARALPVAADGSNPADGNNTPSAFNPPAPRLTSRGFNQGAGPGPGSVPRSLLTTSANDWGNRFLREARALGNRGLEYDEDWRPPGESHAWTMDCSNTARYIYKVTTGIQLPRTASDQYYYLHLQGKAWDVPQASDGWADSNFLRRNLKPGDLLFWENTYRPERQPPITHVMVFLGTNDRGQWIMAGSQTSRGGEHNRRNGGPDIYVFRPSQPCGGYSTWLGMVHHQGRFCAFGRPLDADRSKLAVAAND